MLGSMQSTNGVAPLVMNGWQPMIVWSEGGNGVENAQAILQIGTSGTKKQ